MPADLVELLRQPDWHLHDFDPASQSASLVKLDEALYHSASFLDQRVTPAAHDRMQQPLPDVQRALAEVTAPRDPGFIFHLGHCGSTLLSRALEVYLAGLLGKQAPAQDLRGHAAARLADWAGIDGAPGLDAATLGEAALATLAWLTGFRHLLQAAIVFPGRVQLLDFQVFLDSPAECLAQAGGFLGVGAALPQMLAQWPDVAMGYSKQPGPETTTRWCP